MCCAISLISPMRRSFPNLMKTMSQARRRGVATSSITRAFRFFGYSGGPVRNAIHELKYKRNVALGEFFGRQLIECVRQFGWVLDVVIPVPLGIARLAERGYNQAALLARPIALGMGLSYRPNGLGRVRETLSQVDLNAIERKKNVAGAFRARREQVNGKRILLVDDVATTGSTLDACATALLQGGAVSVFALTLARTFRMPTEGTADARKDEQRPEFLSWGGKDRKSILELEVKMALEVEIYGRNLDVTDRIQDYVDKKVTKLDRYMSGIEEARVDLAYVKSARSAADRQVAQITVPREGHDPSLRGAFR